MDSDLINLLTQVKKSTNGKFIFPPCRHLNNYTRCSPPTGESIAGVVHWHRPQPHADGDSITLYEHKRGSTHHHGDPIADVYAVLARPNSCILAVADGCGWGIKPRLAARCAVHGCMDHLNTKLFDSSKEQITTQDVFLAMFRSLHTAQKCIIDHGGTTTTLCLAVVVELTDSKAMNKWGACVVSVGDSLCYVWRNETQEVYEITSAIREGKERNPRDAGGCLGADLGDHPDLSNLHCCFAPLAENDIILLCSDGISDNFDPVTLREAVSESSIEASQVSNSSDGQPLTPSIPTVTPAQRQSWATVRMARLLKEKWVQKNSLTATDVKDSITNLVIEATEEKRAFLEHTWTNSEGVTLSPAEKREQDRRIGQALKHMPGKLDHATIAVYQVGKGYTSISDQDMRRGHSPTHSYHMNTAAADRLHRGDSFSVHGGTTFYAPAVQGSKEPKPSHIV